MPLYELSDPGSLRRPALVVALDGWVNAGEAGTEAADSLAGDGPVVATFDTDALYDYRVNRPVVDFEEGVMQRVDWPELTLRLGRYEDRDLVVLTGAEPNWRWKRLAAEVADLALTLGVTEHISLGGIPWAVPHTRPVSLITTASEATRLDPTDDHPTGLLQVPGSAVSVLEHAVNQAGIPSSGFWARVPQYLGAAFHAAAVALVERATAHLQVEVDLSELAKQAADQRTQLDTIAEARPDVQAMVSQLEDLLDQQGAVSGEELAAEIERFLRDRGDGGGIDR